MSGERESILGKVSTALKALRSRASLPDWDEELVHLRTTQKSGDLQTMFHDRLIAVSGIMISSVADLVKFLDENGWRHGYCDPALWQRLQSSFPPEFTVETVFDRTRVDDFAFGITAASGAIAETGTLILSDRDTTSRLAAIAPWVHVAVLSPAKIHPDMISALTSMPDDPNVVWVTGPSKTADVEGILIEGVHGPGRQVALVVDL